MTSGNGRLGRAIRRRATTDLLLMTPVVPGQPMLDQAKRGRRHDHRNSEASGMLCTDSTTGHFFTMSRQSYQLG